MLTSADANSRRRAVVPENGGFAGGNVNAPVCALTCRRGPSGDCVPLREAVYGSAQLTPSCVPSVAWQFVQHRFWLSAKKPCFSQLCPICSKRPEPPNIRKR